MLLPTAAMIKAMSVKSQESTRKLMAARTHAGCLAGDQKGEGREGHGWGEEWGVKPSIPTPCHYQSFWFHPSWT